MMLDILQLHEMKQKKNCDAKLLEAPGLKPLSNERKSMFKSYCLNMGLNLTMLEISLNSFVRHNTGKCCCPDRSLHRRFVRENVARIMMTVLTFKTLMMTSFCLKKKQCKKADI